MFTTEVFNQTIQGTTPVISSSELRDVLGRADVLVVEIEITKASTNANVTVKLRHSNSGRKFEDRATLYSNASLSGPAFTIQKAGTEADPLGALVELQIERGNASDEIAIRVVATGRSW